jgi:anti-sigma28 factor (negative regulator of flagellin synthesis)
MNIHDSQRPGASRDAQIDLTRTNREAIAKALETAPQQSAQASGTRKDQLELSTASRILMERAETGAATESEAHAARLAELKQRYLDGTLNTQDRVEQAADAMLSGL